MSHRSSWIRTVLSVTSLALPVVAGLACSQAPAVPASAREGGSPASSEAPSGAPAAVSASGAPTVAAPVEAPRRLVLPDGVCRLTTEDSNGGGVVFRLSPGGVPFASAGFMGGIVGVFGPRKDGGTPATRTEVLLFDAQPTSAGMTFETSRIRVRGHVDMASVRLHIAKATILGGFLIPVSVVPRRIGADGVEAAPALPPSVELVGEAPAWHLGCADLSISEERPDVTAALPAAKKRDEYMLLKVGEPIDLSLLPGGAAVARLRPEEGSARVMVLEKKGNAARIAWDLNALSVFGWVRSSSLEKPKSGRSRGAEGRMVTSSERPRAQASRVCDKDVPLFVAAAGERVEVGAIRSGATLDISERSAGFARVEPPRRPPGPFDGDVLPDVDRAKDAAFWVEESAIAACAPAPGPSAAPPVTPPPSPSGAP